MVSTGPSANRGRAKIRALSQRAHGINNRKPPPLSFDSETSSICYRGSRGARKGYNLHAVNRGSTREGHPVIKDETTSLQEGNAQFSRLHAQLNTQALLNVQAVDQEDVDDEDNILPDSSPSDDMTMQSAEADATTKSTDSLTITGVCSTSPHRAHRGSNHSNHHRGRPNNIGGSRGNRYRDSALGKPKYKNKPRLDSCPYCQSMKQAHSSSGQIWKTTTNTAKFISIFALFVIVGKFSGITDYLFQI